jgi:Tfp pilus assembly protein PilP
MFFGQRLIKFVALVCIAQLVIVGARYLWHYAKPATPKIQYTLSEKNKKADSAGARASLKLNPTTKTPPNSNNTKLNTPPDSSKQTQPNPQAQPTAPADTSSATTAANTNSATNKRDPFIPYFTIRDSGKGSDPTNPLANYGVNQLRLAAILSDGGGKRTATVETDDGKYFIIKEGTPVGADGGQVTTITANSVIITESRSKLGGLIQTQTHELALKVKPVPAGLVVGR